MSQNARVLIVGAGPVGLTMAIMLSMQGIKCRILDKRDLSSHALRAILISKETENIFDSLGIMDLIKSKALAVPSMSVAHYYHGLMKLDNSDSNLANPSFLHIYQPDIESILIARLEGLGIKVERGFELTNLSNQDSCVKATIRIADKTEESKYEFLIGCDGVNSSVRSLANIQYEEMMYNSAFVLADVLVPSVESTPQTYWYIDETGYLSIIPGTRNRLRIIQSVEENNEQMNLTPEILKKLIKQKTHKEIEILDIAWEARSQFRHKIALNGQRKRVFLAGDAYHIFSPIGGVNMNFGLSDAKSLVGYLSLVLAEHQPNRILEQYEKERLIAINKTLDYTKLLTKMMTHPKKHKKLWQLFFSKYLRNASFKKDLMLQISGLSAKMY